MGNILNFAATVDRNRIHENECNMYLECRNYHSEGISNWRKQAGPRGAPSTTRPVRPPMWLSKAELTQEIQRLSNLCEIRTKELNHLKMETKHVSMGFDAFSALFKYMVEDLSALSVPNLTAELDSTLKKLELTKQDLAYYEREVEEIKAHHCQELNDLSNKLFEVYQTEVAELNAKHQEEINQLNDDHQKQIENLSLNFNTSSEEIKAQHEKLISKLEQELLTQREEMRSFQEREIKDLEEKHTQGTKVLQEHIEQLQKKCAELKQHSMSLEDAMRKDTDSKLQWVTTCKVDLEKEVESLKAVLEMRNKELHTLRIQNLEMGKQLEDLPFAREKIKMLQARAEDLEALMNEKTKLERKLCSENEEIRTTYEKEAKVNRRLSMENEELQWRLRQAEQSLLAGSFPEADETREETDDATTPSKSPAPPILSKSVFFTYVDKDESLGVSPRTPYKRIMPGFSSNYKTSPGKASKSYLAPSPRKPKSLSEPPLPPSFASTPRKVSKQASPKCNKKRQKSGSESGQHPDEHEMILSVTESMASSVSSENSIPEHKALLEEHKEQIMASLEIIREQRSTHELQMSQSMVEKQVSRPSNFETDMSRSAEFADPKAFYHMTFAVMKEPGTDTDSSKVSSCNSSKEITPITMHSIAESSLNHNFKKNTEQNAVQINVPATEISTSVTVDSSRENKPTQITSAHSTENFQNTEANACDTADHWRTI
ncbi:microtubule-associated tumor suppressor candidate 2 homolog isoform X2 [Uloborus diversus]|uniref:microtubule-associated tumor suppressor candidate 2 homolog isoform X2 n=1 Tax=Uloborus diversus TaxID=327109 RepID=UPI00240961F0|nr:microtubule-associated tumor suppressor candidate 2 homolog isoform X2 [Uloborus diversus]